ncbi:CopG family transcriptional regulator [Leptospira sp. 2 VSF19]|uniref:CopG family transcriptional regulator n=1 Tax=Leptospira soteropolitanensis TaxID=2950025 RepID=A0AAW5VRU9_9LEPT|nr:CopG family transcriptional regulator [Leptospira soteropolitanensis]MCW7494819.1 CopG family transcriptional regulator [Leptospira soteropolitanensis]MCW7502407.1 CopG family transcriptional regulator [Leptospira soteropolitanensis]MCW7524644.1 CopG family transcriptional regulator [Leptospira soteropolitanensis]MCW7528515.1 CopG family transcriptional regulator [Leptospira soteropolitanensis]MCW7532376.1 CopG family transcriptional regulator [Leptospira soteropolitanensis]
MKKKTNYTKTPNDVMKAINSSLVINDFLPPPDKLITKEDNSKVTILLSKKSISFFKAQSKKSGVPYQSMIKKVLDLYADRFAHK